MKISGKPRPLWLLMLMRQAALYLHHSSLSGRRQRHSSGMASVWCLSEERPEGLCGNKPNHHLPGERQQRGPGRGRKSELAH
jgi:hypothetical protein